MNPTKQQQLILEHEGNAVVIAAPGSGKTFVVSNKIKLNLKKLLPHQGIIAISYTNKASNELKHRSLSRGENPQSSFFGTIDKFYLSEIVIPFGKQLLGLPIKPFEIVSLKSLPKEEQKEVSWANHSLSSNNIDKAQFEKLTRLFNRGIILLETVGILANFIFDHSKACKKYLSARYRYLYIDEYQDAGQEQHILFLKIMALGINSIAVGDLNQSIYAFSGKDAKFLEELTKNPDFKYFKLDKNHRCDASIINYSNYLLNPKTEMIEAKFKHVYFRRVEGEEKATSSYIDSILDKVKKMYKVEFGANIAILTRSRRTAELIDQSLNAPHTYTENTELDQSLNVWSSIFSNLLFFLFDPSYRFLNVIEVFTSYDQFSQIELKRLALLKGQLEGYRTMPLGHVKNIIKILIQLAKLIAPQSYSEESITLLKRILTPPYNIKSYQSSHKDEVKVMTIHKSKGLEFDVVFHLDLHEWIFPKKTPGEGQEGFKSPIYADWKQDLNLHYVAITRARKCCILLSSTQRRNADMVLKTGKDSEFLTKNGIEKYRFVSS